MIVSKYLQETGVKHMKKKCRKCNSILFFIYEKNNCFECKYNGVWVTDGSVDGLGLYTYDTKVIEDNNMIRSEVENDGCCQCGEAFGQGCIMFVCQICGAIDNIALSDGA